MADTVHRLQDFGLKLHYAESGDICVEPGCLTYQVAHLLMKMWAHYWQIYKVCSVSYSTVAKNCNLHSFRMSYQFFLPSRFMILAKVNSSSLLPMCSHHYFGRMAVLSFSVSIHMNVPHNLSNLLLLCRTE